MSDISKKHRVSKLDRRHRGSDWFEYMITFDIQTGPWRRLSRAHQLQHFYDLIHHLTENWGNSVELDHWYAMRHAQLSPDVFYVYDPDGTLAKFRTLANPHWCYESHARRAGRSNGTRIYLASELELSAFLLVHN